MSATDPRNPDRNRQWSEDDRERRVQRRAQWGNWEVNRRQPVQRWDGVTRG